MKKYWRTTFLIICLMIFILFFNSSVLAYSETTTTTTTTTTPSPNRATETTTTTTTSPVSAGTSTSVTTTTVPPTVPPTEREPLTQPPNYDTPLRVLMNTTQELSKTLTGTITTDDLSNTPIINNRLIESLNNITSPSDVTAALATLQNALITYRKAYVSTKNQVFIDYANTLSIEMSQSIQLVSLPSDVLMQTKTTLATLKTIDAVLLSSDKRIEVTAKRLIDASSRTVSTERISFTLIYNGNSTFTIDKIRAMQKSKQIFNYHNALQAELITFFGVNNVHVLDRQIIFVLDTPREDMGIKASIATDVAAILKLYSINKLSFMINGTTVSLPLDLFNDNKIVELIMTFDYVQRPAAAAKSTYRDGYVVDIVYYVNYKMVSTLSSPMVLSFPIDRYDFGGTTNPDQLAIYRFNIGMNAWLPVGGIYEPISHTLTCYRDNLSQYTILKSTKTFSDIGNTTAKNSINKLLNKGVIQGSTKFNPKTNITREEFVGWIAKAYGLESKGTKPLPFTDVNKNSPYYDAIVVVYSQGIVSGKTATAFNPKGTVSKQEMASILSTTLQKYQDKKVNVALSKKLQASAKNLPTWSVGSMSLMLELGLYSETDMKTNTAFVTKENAATVFGKIY